MRTFFTKIQYITILSILLVSGTLYSKPSGIIDLRTNNLSAHSVTLKENWEFYWNQYYTPDDFVSGVSNDYETISGMYYWEKSGLTNTNIQPFGYATVRTTILLPDGAKEIGLKIPSLITASRVWANGKLILSAGHAGTNRAETQPRYIPLVAYLSVPSGRLELVIHIANFHHLGGGFSAPLKIATQKQMERESLICTFLDALIMGSIFFMGLYHLCIFILRRNDKSFLILTLMCITIACRNLLLGDYLFLRLFTDHNWQFYMRGTYFLSYLILPLVVYFIYLVFPRSIDKRAVIAVNILTFIYMIPVFFLPAYVFTRLLSYYALVFMPFFIYIPFILVRELVRRNYSVVFIIAGFTFLLAATFNDLLVFTKLYYFPEMAKYGFFVFLLSQAATLAYRFSYALDTAESLSLDLEDKVEERTLLLEEERAILEQKNRTLEDELDLARSIQQQFIPQKSPDPSIAFYYRSMEKVGGDFFHFIVFPDDRIGIFISDVSGHGVPAAFMTSMLHGFILEAGITLENPALFLRRLNGSLIDRTAGNFVTAFYGIIDPLHKKLLYSSAAHNPPFLIKDDSIIPLSEGKNGFVIGMFDNPKLDDMNIEYVNHTVNLSGYSKLLLYTDGLTEAISVNYTDEDKQHELEDFGKKALTNAIRENAGLKSKAFVSEIVRNLIDFRGADSFDDDVCIICVDLD